MPASARTALVDRLGANKAALGLKTVDRYRGQFQAAAQKAVDLGSKSPAAFVLNARGELARTLDLHRMTVLVYVRDRGLARDDDEAAGLAERLGRWLLENPAWEADDGDRPAFCVVEDQGVACDLFLQAPAFAVWAVTFTLDQSA